MKNFEYGIRELFNKMDDLAGELFDNEEVKAYFVEHYGYNEEEDDAIYMVFKYFAESYDLD